jgi:hypothetical protein
MKPNYFSLAFFISIIILGDSQMQAQQFAKLNSPNKSFSISEITAVKSNFDLAFADSSVKQSRLKKMMNSPGMGALTGFIIGGAGGVALGLTGKEWVLHNGKIVPRPIHAIVDAFIVGTPLATMGLVWGARKDRSTLEPSKWHVAIAGGWSSGAPYKSMLNAATVSGLPRHIPHWFGYLHYPNGENSSTPYTWNLSLDYNFTKKFSAGFAFNNFVKQEIAGGLDHHAAWHDYEYALGKSYSLLADYTINPIVPENKTRLVFAVGAGASVHHLIAGGLLGDDEYRFVKTSVTPHFRATVDYMSTKKLSLQLKAGYKPYQTIRIPEQTDGVNTLYAHAINFRALDITVAIRYHFNNLKF